MARVRRAGFPRLHAGWLCGGTELRQAEAERTGAMVADRAGQRHRRRRARNFGARADSRMVVQLQRRNADLARTAVGRTESRPQTGGAAHRGGAGANRRRGRRSLARRIGQCFVGASAAQHQYAERRHFRLQLSRTCPRRWSIPTTSISSASAPPGRSIFSAASGARSRPPTPRWRRRSRARTRRSSRW